jgi:hypothetical protein
VIILYNPQSSEGRKPILPISLLAVGALLEGRHDYVIVDGNLEADPLRALAERIEPAQAAGPAPTVLGVTVMPGPQLQQAAPLCRELKRRFPALVVVWGGYFPTQHWEVCLRAAYVDYVVRGHGEHAFAALLEHLSTGLPAREQIAGLAYRGPGGEPQSNALPGVPHPARLPALNLERVPVTRYLRPTFLGTRTLGYHSSYGCPFFCNFCAVVNMVNGRWLAQTAAQTAAGVEAYARRWGANAVEFYDNNFFVHEARTAEFAERIEGLGIAWWGEARIDTLLLYRADTWRKMRDAGLRMMFMGAESGSLETLQRMDKGGTMTPDKTLEIARRMAEWDIIPEFSFVMGNPPDPEADVRQTMEFIRRVKAANPQSEIIMYLYTPVPLAGDLYEQAQAQGFAFPETLDEWISPAWINFSQRRSTTMPWVKQPVREQLRDFERVLNAYYPTATDVRLAKAWRQVLRAAAAWRYHLRFYRFPLELRALHRLVAYQRPETSGF